MVCLRNICINTLHKGDNDDDDDDDDDNVAVPLILNLPKIDTEKIMKYENLALEIKISGGLTTYLYTP